MSTYYHLSPAENRDSILEVGLLPRNTGEHHFDSATDNHGVAAVYLLPRPDQAKEWADWYAHHDYTRFDIWAVELHTEVVEPDPYGISEGGPLDGAVRCLDPIPPTRLMLHDAVVLED